VANILTGNSKQVASSAAPLWFLAWLTLQP
jgi:hypothetical protein